MTFSTIMAHLELGRSNERLVNLTAELAKRLATDVIGVAACQPIQILYGEVYVAGDLIQMDRDEIDRETKVAEAEFRAALAGHAQTLDWRTAVTCLPLAGYICDQARAAELIITSPDRGGRPFESNRRASIGDLVMQAGRPVLIAPATATTLDLEHVLIAWKDTRETRRAVADALPLLEQAGQVSVVEVAEHTDLEDAEARVADVADWLKRNGIGAQGLAIAAAGDVAVQLDTLARERDVGLMVAGAYGHTRLREWAFGGVTQQALMHPRRCTLVSH